MKRSMHLLSGTKHKLESKSHSLEPPPKKGDVIWAKPAIKTDQAIIDQLSCPITHELFFDPIRAEPSQHYYERSQFFEWRKHKNTDPLTREIITGHSEPDRMVHSLMDERFKEHPEINKQRYFNLSLLLSALMNNETKVIERFISLFEISPERLETLSDQKEIEHFTEITLF
jgi:hypothetical protein